MLLSPGGNSAGDFLFLGLHRLDDDYTDPVLGFFSAFVGVIINKPMCL